jgi:phenylalanyl-tRNA synthetase alpha chain
VLRGTSFFIIYIGQQMLDKIDQIKKQFDADCQSIKNLESLENLRIKYLGRKGLVSEAFSLLSQVSKDEKPKFGQGLNKLKVLIEK